MNMTSKDLDEEAFECHAKVWDGGARYHKAPAFYGAHQEDRQLRGVRSPHSSEGTPEQARLGHSFECQW